MLLVRSTFVGGEGEIAPAATEAGLKIATFAGGCFWCMEPPFDKIDGVVRTTSGYTGGHQDSHLRRRERRLHGSRRVRRDRLRSDQGELRAASRGLLEKHRPVATDRQFCDVGTQYRSAIFTHDDAQRAAAEASKKALEDSGALNGAKVATEIAAATTFYPAEEYHQDYYVKNPLRYKYYRWGCGRDQRLDQLWGAQRQNP